MYLPKKAVPRIASNPRPDQTIRPSLNGEFETHTGRAREVWARQLWALIFVVQATNGVLAYATAAAEAERRRAGIMPPLSARIR